MAELWCRYTQLKLMYTKPVSSFYTDYVDLSHNHLVALNKSLYLSL